MKKQFTIYCLILSFFFFLAGVKIASAKVINCQGWTHPTETCPNIQSVFPETATINDTFVITGSEFEQEQGTNKISFWYDDPNASYTRDATYDAKGQIISWSDNEIKYKPDIWDAHSNTQRNRYICIKKCNNINGCDESCFNSTINIKSPCSSYTYSSWSICSENSQQTRTVISSIPDNCDGGTPPVLSQSCIYTPSCTENNWSCTDWSSCSSNGKQTRTCDKTTNCQGDVSAPATSQSCTYIPQCTSYSWSCAPWSSCSSNGTQTRTCNKTSNCEGGTQSPATTQSCSYTPACSADTWQCGNWGTCSPIGIQTRGCTKTYDCPSAETASPTTSQYCQTSNTTPSNTNNEPATNINRDQILKATVKLICPIDSESGWQGSGTVIDQYGTILTNRHVVDGSIGICRVGFINSESDIPYFSEIADVKKVSSDRSLNGDMAILKVRNNTNKNFTAIDISLGNSDNLKSGDYISPFGYPKQEEFGEAITFTEGPYSGRGTSVIIERYKWDVSKFFKTTAVIEHGSSGGGAYQKSTGYYMGIPTLGFEKVNYILSANYIRQWINSFDRSYSVTRNNFSNISNYYKETIPIESIDLNMLKKLDSSTNLLNQVSSESSATESEIVIQEEKNLTTKIDNSLSKRVSGKILLQVEKNGEGWYIYPDNKKKYYLGRPADAFSIMRNLGLGIKHSELENYLKTKFPNRLAGKIMLDVEQNGEAYYVNPNDLEGYYLNRPADAFRIMRELGLGITNSDIRKIDVGEINN